MNIFTKNIFLLLTTTINIVLIGMDLSYPQLQLQEKPTQLCLEAKLKLKNLTPTYVPDSAHKEHMLRFNSSAKTPCLLVSLNIKNHNAFKVSQHILTLIPATLVDHCNDNSRVDFTRTIDEKVYCIKAICQRNTKLSNESFKDQYNASMKCFYEKGAFFTQEPDSPYMIELGNANIINTEIAQFFIVNRGIPIFTPFGIFAIQMPNVEGLFFSHGINGCSSEKQFTELMTQRKTKLYGNSAFSYVMQHQIGKPLSKPNNLIEEEKEIQRKIPNTTTVTALWNLPNSSDPLYKLSKKFAFDQECTHSQKKTCTDLPRKNTQVQDSEILSGQQIKSITQNRNKHCAIS